MPKKRKSAKAQKPRAAFEKQVRQFGEEAETLGKKIGAKGEEFGKAMEKKSNDCRGWCCCDGRGPFGAVGLIVSIIIGILGLAVSIWALDFLARKTASPILSALHVFLFANTGVFILIFLLSALLTYVSRCCRSGYLLVSPASAAFGGLAFFWIAASIIAIANAGIGNPVLSVASAYVLKHLWQIFWIFLVIGYFFMFLRLLFGGIAGCFPKEPPVAAAPKPHKIPASGPKRLYRSGKDKILGGVCGGIAEYLGVDPVLIRLIWAIAVFFYGTGILLYIICWIIIPRNPEHEWKD